MGWARGLGVALQAGRQAGRCAEVLATFVRVMAGALWSLLIPETDRLECGLARTAMRHGKNSMKVRMVLTLLNRLESEKPTF